MLVFDCKLIRPVLCSFPTGFLVNTQLYLSGVKGIPIIPAGQHFVGGISPHLLDG
jgi:hypothetical protein